MRTTILNSARIAILLRRPSILLLAMAFICLLTTACRTSVTEQNKDVVIGSPATGIVRRVLVDEGASVEKSAPIIEIAVQPGQARASQTGNSNANQALAARAAETNLASAQVEANRTSAELRRIEPLVKRGLASKAELDKARAQSLDAQERLRLARESAQSAEANRNQPPSIAPSEEIVTVRTPAAGTVRAFNIRVGDQVVTGQPLATLVSHT
jgi:multidrug resistance efflux pump